MSYEILQKVSLICAIGSLVMTVVAVVLFFLLDIRSVIGFFTGRTRRKGIDEIRKAAQEGTLDHRSVTQSAGGQTDKKRRKKTEPKASRNAVPQKVAVKEDRGENVITDRLPNRAAAYSDGSEQTTLLGAQTAQSVMQPNADNLTTVLTENFVPETTVLTAQTPVQAAVFVQQPFEIEFDITYIHSDEVI